MAKPSFKIDGTDSEDIASAWASSLLDAVVPHKPADAEEDWYPKRCGMLGDWGFAQDQSVSPDTESSRCLTVSYFGCRHK